MMFMSSKLVYKSRQVKNHHVYINIYLTHIVLSTMCGHIGIANVSHVSDCPSLYMSAWVCLIVITGVGRVLIRVHETSAMIQ